MAEYIDREEIKEWIAAWLKENKNWHPYSKGKDIPTTVMFDMLTIIPAADVQPVVRCKDCAYYDFDETYNKHWCNRTYGCTEVKPDHFCSYGKGRT